MGKIINKKDVEHIAKLAELSYGADEIDKITGELDKIIEHVANISSADTSNVKPTSHVTDLGNVFREDEPKVSLSSEEALSNAPLESGGGFKVPKID